MKTKQAIIELAERLNYEKNEIAIGFIVEQLAELNAWEYMEKIAIYLKSSAISLRLSAIRSLSRLVKVQQGLERIKEGKENLKPIDLSGALNITVMKAISYFQAKEYVKDIADLLNDKNDLVQQVAVETLVALNAKEYIKDIAILLKKNTEVRNDTCDKTTT